MYAREYESFLDLVEVCVFGLANAKRLHVMLLKCVKNVILDTPKRFHKHASVTVRRTYDLRRQQADASKQMFRMHMR